MIYGHVSVWKSLTGKVHASRTCLGFSLATAERLVMARADLQELWSGEVNGAPGYPPAHPSGMICICAWDLVPDRHLQPRRQATLAGRRA